MLYIIGKVCALNKKGGEVVGIRSEYDGNLRHIEYAMEKYSRMLMRVTYSILSDEHDAEDAIQETFIRYMTKAPLFRDSDHEKAWLIKVATNVSRNMLRLKNRQNLHSDEELASIGVAEENNMVFEFIMQLPPKYRLVLELYYIEGYKAKEISAIIGITQVAVRKRLQYARALLKNEMERIDLE